MAGWRSLTAVGVVVGMVGGVGCMVNEGGPSTAGSPAAAELATVERISQQAAEIEGLAEKLEAMTDTAREAAPGAPRQAVIQEMRALMGEIQRKNEALQGEVQGLEARIHEAAKDPTWGAVAGGDGDE